jgi:hypothetical protein
MKRFAAVSPFPSCFSTSYTPVWPILGLAKRRSDPTPAFSVDCALFAHFSSQKYRTTLLESMCSALFEKQRRGWGSHSHFSSDFLCTIDKSFRIRLYAQRARNPFRIRLYAKQPGCVTPSFPSQKCPRPFEAQGKQSAAT